MISLVEVNKSLEFEVGLASWYYYNLIKMQNVDAKRLGLNDVEADTYTIENAKSSVLHKSRQTWLIKDGNEFVGVVSYGINRSIIGTEKDKSCFIYGLYVDEQSRGCGIGTTVIDMLRDKYKGCDIELNCYYELIAHDFFRKLGFKPVYTRYSLSRVKQIEEQTK